MEIKVAFNFIYTMDYIFAGSHTEHWWRCSLDVSANKYICYVANVTPLSMHQCNLWYPLCSSQSQILCMLFELLQSVIYYFAGTKPSDAKLHGIAS